MFNYFADRWWFNDGSKRRGGQAVNRDDFDQRTVFIVSGFATPKEVPVVDASADDIKPESIDSKYHNHRTFLLPTVYGSFIISIFQLKLCKSGIVLCYSLHRDLCRSHWMQHLVQ